MFSNGVAEANIGLKQTVIAALSSAVKEEDYRPFLVRIVVVRNVDLITVSFAANSNRSVE